MFKESDESIQERIERIDGLGGMTVNERLYHSGLVKELEDAIINDKPRAKQILRWLRVNDEAIDLIVNHPLTTKRNSSKNTAITTIRKIFTRRTIWIHLLLVLVAQVILAGLLYVLVIPLVFWSIFGEGASSDRATNLTINRFISEGAPLIVVLLISAAYVAWNVWQQELSKAKSHLITAGIVTVLYIFRLPLIDAIIGI
jgi:hypothetical protein